MYRHKSRYKNFMNQPVQLWDKQSTVGSYPDPKSFARTWVIITNLMRNYHRKSYTINVDN